jgi:hypothetical protein
MKCANGLYMQQNINGTKQFCEPCPAGFNCTKGYDNLIILPSYFVNGNLLQTGNQ